jgi:hypothetical protein
MIFSFFTGFFFWVQAVRFFDRFQAWLQARRVIFNVSVACGNAKFFRSVLFLFAGLTVQALETLKINSHAALATEDSIQRFVREGAFIPSSWFLPVSIHFDTS